MRNSKVSISKPKAPSISSNTRSAYLAASWGTRAVLVVVEVVAVVAAFVKALQTP